MKNLKTLLILLFVSAITKAQTTSDEKAFGEGKASVTVGYGFPNIYKSIFKSAYSTSSSSSFYGGSSSDYSIKGIGPAFVKFEYGLNKVVAIGAAIGYYNFTFTETDNVSSYDPYSGASVNYTDVYKYYYTSFSAGVRLNFHFATGKKLDPYAGIAGGYSGNKFTLSQSSNDPNFSPKVIITGTGIPVYFAITAGLRYYFTKNIGAYLEVGIDKWSVIQGGLAVKF